MSRTAITLNFKLYWFQTKHAFELKGCKHATMPHEDKNYRGSL